MHITFTIFFYLVFILAMKLFCRYGFECEEHIFCLQCVSPELKRVEVKKELFELTVRYISKTDRHL